MGIEKETVDEFVSDALGVKGFIIRGVDGEMYFRVYNEHRNFVDYEITNHDFEVVIIDKDAALLTNQAGNFLDYTPESMNAVK